MKKDRKLACRRGRRTFTEAGRRWKHLKQDEIERCLMPDGEPRGHAGSRSHPCEGCGRVGGRS